jgi:hypothetical protein
MTRVFDLQLTDWLDKMEVSSSSTGGRIVRPDVMGMMW